MFKRQGSTVLLACQALLFVGTRFESICIVLSNGNGALSGRKSGSKMKSYYKFSRECQVGDKAIELRSFPTGSEPAVDSLRSLLDASRGAGRMAMVRLGSPQVLIG
jgi:hypothetical protein